MDMENKKSGISRKQYYDLVVELNYMETVQERSFANKIREARRLGDLTENPAYDKAKEEHYSCLHRIVEYKNIINNSVITDTAPPVLKCRSFEEIMQEYTAKTELSEQLDEFLPEEIKYFMRRLAGHSFSSECCFKSEIDVTHSFSPLRPYGYTPFASAARDYYWYLRDDGMVYYVTPESEYHDEIYDEDEEYGDITMIVDEVAKPMDVSFGQFVIFADLYGQFERTFDQYKEDDQNAFCDHTYPLEKCTDDCKFCELEQEFKVELLTIDKDLINRTKTILLLPNE